jgi:hypothetical protein
MAVTRQSGVVAGGPVPVGPDLSVAPGERSRLNRWLSATGAVSVCAAGLAYISAFDPNVATSPYPKCLLKQLTGIDCPGCGGTRAMYSLLHGDVVGAADHNILIFIVAPLIIYLVARFALGQFGVRLPAPRVRPWMAWGAASFMLVFAIVRNIPGTPLHYLRSEVG